MFPLAGVQRRGWTSAVRIGFIAVLAFLAGCASPAADFATARVALTERGQPALALIVLDNAVAAGELSMLVELKDRRFNQGSLEL